MEKSQTELLQQFQEEIEALKQRIAALESKLTAFQAGEWQADDEAVDFTDVEIGIEEPSAPAEAPVETPVVKEPEPAVLAPEPKPAPKPEPKPEPAAAAPQAPSAEDETLHLPWRTDKPGMPVKNIRSGISLLDRALFIGTLFKEDFALYDQTIADLNAMENLEEAVDYIRERFPAWNLKSDVVYHFMMSVRKKLG